MTEEELEILDEWYQTEYLRRKKRNIKTKVV